MNTTPDISPKTGPPARGDIYTAAELAAAVGRTRQAVYALLKDIPAPLQKIVRGQKQAADAWPIKALPERLRGQLETMAKRQGCRNVEHLLFDHARPWECPLPWDKIAASYQERAEKLCLALADLLPLQHSLSADELQQRGSLEYQRVFGHPIQPRTWRRLFDRTVERDRFQENWQRVEIYLDDEAFQRCGTSREVLKLRGLHRPLDEIITHLENRTKPTSGDKAWLFDAAFHHFESVVERRTGSDRRTVKASLLDYLSNALPGLSRNIASLRRLFDDNFKTWTEGGRNAAALEDDRRIKSGNFRRPDFTADLELIRNEAIRRGGNESAAHYHLRKTGQLSREFVDHYSSFDARVNKSSVPNGVRVGITGQVDLTMPYFRSPKEARLAAPRIQRDWSDAVPGDIFTADDVTLNNYWWDTNAAGEPYITRGECLLFTDEFTEVPLAFSLHGREDIDPLGPERRKVSYNQMHIRRGMLKVHDDHGLPDLGWRFEGGTWQARLITGDKVAGALHLHWRDTENNCDGKIFNADDAQKIFHAKEAPAKTIERTLLSLQQEMRTDPAFVGFDERRENMERMQKIIRRVRAGSEHPGNLGIPSREDFVKTIHQRLQDYLHDPKNGKRHQGKTPWEMWQERIDRKPLKRLPAEARWVFASHFKRLKIRDGRINLRDYTYANDATAKWNTREVLAFFNVECPEVLVFSDLKRTQFHAVRTHVLPARNATAEQFKAARFDLSAQTRAAREIYHSVMHPVKSSITRDDEHSQTTKEIGKLINASVAAHRAEADTEKNLLEKIRRNCERLGRPMPLTMRSPESVLRGLEMEIEMQANGNEVDHV